VLDHDGFQLYETQAILRYTASSSGPENRLG
jgi:glutathione S-transferase